MSTNVLEDRGPKTEKFGSLEMTVLNEEHTRVYHFPNGAHTKIEAVTHLAVSKSGTHRLRDAEGFYHIVPTGWLRISLDLPKGWTL